MPKKLESCVSNLVSKGYTEQQAYAICTASIEQSKTKVKIPKDKETYGRPKTL